MSARIKIVRGLTLHGERIYDGSLDRNGFLERIGVGNSTFRSAVQPIGGTDNDIGLQFLEARENEETGEKQLMFGPGTGLVLGVSLGTTTLRAGLFDANGKMHHEWEGAPEPEQLAAKPDEILGWIREAAAAVMTPALKDDKLKVGKKLRFLGIAVAWPCPVDRDKKSNGHVLSDPGWGNRKPLDERVANELKLDQHLSHALNDSHAAAIAVAFNRTREATHVEQSHPELTIVVRLAGGVSAATIVVEPPQNGGGGQVGYMSGFADSILLGGRDSQAGELGHVAICQSAVEKCNQERPRGLKLLSAYQCSCTAQSQKSPPNHLEAYASRSALARRIDPKRPEDVVIEKVLNNPEKEVHGRALEDIGVLVGDSLRGVVAMLNPSRIMLTGSLAVPTVRDAVDEELRDEHEVNSHPEVVALEGEDKPFVAAKGAALAVIRQQVYRQFDAVLQGRPAAIATRMKAGTKDLEELPWKKPPRKRHPTR